MRNSHFCRVVFIRSITIFPLLLVFLALPVTGLAQAGLSITAILPSSIANTSASTLTIMGSGFENGAVIALNNYGELPSTFIDNQTLTATVPAGLPAGSYDVIVTNPDSSSVTLQDGLVIFAPSPTPSPEPPPAPFERPVIVIKSYSASRSKVGQGQEFELKVQIYNAGQKMAMNIVATFLSSDATPRQTGGVIAISEVAPDNRYDMVQPMTAGYDLWGKTSLAVELNLVYTDDSGNPYTEKFNLAIPIEPPLYIVSTATPTPTPTPTVGPVERPQLVISSYQTDVAPLQPGTSFLLDLDIVNLGNAPAHRITMIVGGGSAVQSTADLGGISGGSGEFTHFAPLGSSNVQSIGDLPIGAKIQTKQPLIVNVSTNPGAYPMKISFVYLNEKGDMVMDEQVITLLVYSLPNVEISFYRDPNPIFAGQPSALPLQIVNLGRSSAILGNMTVSSPSGQVTNNIILVGTLEAGGYFTLDATLFPEISGPMELNISVDYTDDFNQPRTINKILVVDVMEAFEPEPINPEGDGSAGEIPISPAVEETIWQKLLRFLLGILGLDSYLQQPSEAIDYPIQESNPDKMESVPLPPLKGP